MKRFRDFADEQVSLEGTKVKIGELFNREIVILDFRLMLSKCPGLDNKECLQIQFSYSEDDETRYVTFTNSTVLIKQLQKYQTELPFLATIEKRGSYYTLV